MPDPDITPEPDAPAPEPTPESTPVPEPEPEDPGVRVGTRAGEPVFVSRVKLAAMYRRQGARVVERYRVGVTRGLTLEITPEDFDRLFVESRPQ